MPMATISPVSGENPRPSFTAFTSSSVSAYFRRYSWVDSSKASKSAPIVSMSTTILDIDGFNTILCKDARICRGRSCACPCSGYMGKKRTGTRPNRRAGTRPAPTMSFIDRIPTIFGFLFLQISTILGYIKHPKQ